MDVVAVGSPEFTLGFELVGLKTFSYSAVDELKSLPKEKVGVVIIEDSVMQRFADEDRKFFEDSISPLFVVLSKKSEQESLNRLIRRSIGI